MRSLVFGFSCFVSLWMANSAFGQQPQQAKMDSTTKFSSEIQKMEPLNSLKQEKAPPARQSPLAPVKLPPLIPQQASYLHPGVLVLLNGKWEGNDHLLNLTNHIGVYVSIIKPEDAKLEITEAEIQKEVEKIFSEANIQPQTLVMDGKAPLPAFEIEIFVYPIEKGYAACCQGRLFESVVLDRFKMNSNMAFQAITWEKQHLIVSPKSQFVEQITKTVQEIAETFTERFQAYEQIKKGV